MMQRSLALTAFCLLICAFLVGCDAHVCWTRRNADCDYFLPRPHGYLPSRLTSSMRRVHPAKASATIYQSGDSYIAVSLIGLAYPAAKLPDGVPLDPFKLPSDARRPARPAAIARGQSRVGAYRDHGRILQRREEARLIVSRGSACGSTASRHTQANLIAGSSAMASTRMVR